MKSLTSRLVATAVLLVALVTLLIGTATTLSMRNSLTGRLDREVIASLNRVPPDGRLPRGSDDGDGDSRYDDKQQVGTLIGVLSPAGSGASVSTESSFVRISTTGLTMLEELPADRSPTTVDLPGVGDYRVATKSTPFGTLIAGLPTTPVDDAISSLVWVEILVGLLGVGAAGLAGTVLVRHQLGPLREVAATAHEVAILPLESGEVDLSPRVPDPDPGTEVGQVGAALNTLLAHVESSLSARHESELQVRQFVADASHELRTPLSTIRGYAELSRRTPDDAVALSASLAKVSSEADRMSTLVDDLLLLARLDAGRPLSRDPVDLTRLLLEAVSDARVVGPDHKWRLDLPDEPLEITGDEQRLHQVVTNLLTNARRHTPTGTTVEVAARPVPGAVEVVFADDGPGFPSDLAKSAFERFTRGDAARTRSSGGAGLGLSIVAAIVRAHGGDVRLESVPGSTRISVRLPLDHQP